MVGTVHQPSSQRMPAAFLGHGNPMNALERNRYTEAWRGFGEACGKPRAVLMISAHWYTNATAVTAMALPRTIHDFYGFPEELDRFAYPAPGSPDLAEEVAELALPDRIGLDHGSWGLDHGAWSVLTHAFPLADVPVVQLAINALQPFEYHLELAARLAPLRERGIVIIGSGNLVHNLHRIKWGLADEGFEWAREFDETARQLAVSAPSQLLGLREHEHYPLAAPTPDHFIPLLYFAALADVAEEPAEVLVEGYAYGSVSMTAFALGIPTHRATPEPSIAEEPAPPLPDPATAPAEQLNL